MKIFFNGFWPGFFDGRDPINVNFFLKLVRDLISCQEISIGSGADESDILFESCFGASMCLHKKKWKYKFAFSGENFLNSLWYDNVDCIFSGSHGDTENKKVIHLPMFYVFDENVKISREIWSTVPQKNICAVISNAHGQDRNRLLELIETKFPIDYGGTYKNNIGKSLQGNYASDDVRDFIKQYKCVISMENSGNNDGYITEKILHGLNNGTVPIYWGSHKVTTYFNEKRFIDLTGKSNEQVLSEIERVLNLGSEDYLKMVNEPIFNQMFDYDGMLQDARHLIGFGLEPVQVQVQVENVPTPTILLNMIVKNEAHVIEKTLGNLCDKINFSYYVISDTGSTDDTKAKIKNFFESKNIPGEIHDDPWKDFGYNRTCALKHAFNKSDLLLVFDADDELKGTFPILSSVDFDAYQLHFGDGYTLNYWRVCMVNNRKKWKYVGVLHEYIALDDEGNRDIVETKKCLPNAYLNGDYFVVHGVTGGRSNDPLKYHKDAEILSKAFYELPETNDLRNRYAFYCANSYRDAGNIEKAIEWYLIAVKLSGWSQEKYRCCIMLFNLYKSINEIEKALYWCVESVKFDNNRIEGIFKLVQHYCCENQNNVAMAYYQLVSEWYEKVYMTSADTILSDKLFVDILEYDFFLPYYMIIVSDKVGKRDIGLIMYKLIFTKGKISTQWWMDNLCFNFQFFFKLIDEKDRKDMVAKAKKYIKVMIENNLKVKESFLQNVYELSMS
jgi:tetratricopeptide (TPR) repeat protein